MIRGLWAALVEWLYLRTMQTRQVEGTDPDDGGHGQLWVAWNSRSGHNRPVFAVIMNHTKNGYRTRMLLSPSQLNGLRKHIAEGIALQSINFGYDVLEPPDYDTRWVRVSDDEAGPRT